MKCVVGSLERSCAGKSPSIRREWIEMTMQEWQTGREIVSLRMERVD